VPLEAVGLPEEAMRVLWRLRVLLEVMIGIFEPKRLLVKAKRMFVKAVKMHVKSIRMLVDAKRVLV
jgi:hypothetical protein